MFTNTPMEVSLWLKRHKINKAGKAPISIRITINEQRAELATKVRIEPSSWCSKTCKLLGDSEDIINYRSILKTLESKVWLTKERIDKPGLTAKDVSAAMRPAKQQLCLLASAQLQLDGYYQGLNASTHETFARSLSHLRKWHGSARLPLDTFTMERRREFAFWLCQRMSSASARTYLDGLKALWNRAHVWGALGQCNPFAGIRLPKHEARQRLSLTSSQVKKLRTMDLPDTLAEARDLYLACLFLHGSRIGVVLSMEWKQVNLATGIIRFKAAKGGKHKEVEIHPGLADILWQRKQAGGKLVFGLLQPDYHGLTGRLQLEAMRRARTVLWSRLQGVARRLGVEHLHIHTARHTMALLTYETTKDIRAAQNMLGHNNPRTTEIYIRSMQQAEINEAARSVYDTL